MRVVSQAKQREKICSVIVQAHQKNRNFHLPSSTLVTCSFYSPEQNHPISHNQHGIQNTPLVTLRIISDVAHLHK